MHSKLANVMADNALYMLYTPGKFIVKFEVIYNNKHVILEEELSEEYIWLHRTSAAGLLYPQTLQKKSPRWL